MVDKQLNGLINQPIRLIVALLGTLVLNTMAVTTAADDAIPVIAKTVQPMDSEGMVHFPAMTIPQSNALSEESKQANLKFFNHYWKELEKMYVHCGKRLFEATLEELPGIRKCRAQAFKNTTWYRDIMALYPVDIEEVKIDGIVADVYTPKSGIAGKNKDRVLIHLHSGAHFLGSRWVGNIAAPPISVLGKIKVISVDYRQYPEAVHPSALVDTVKVYKALIKDYKPENIGIYGSSSGATYTGQLIPWIEKSGLPRPGAIGVFGMGFGPGSDSLFIGSIFFGYPTLTPERYKKIITNTDGTYFEGSSYGDPYVRPANYPNLLKSYPPTLFITATRDTGLSSVAYSHSQLVKSGVESDLHVWEGLSHWFISNPLLPEARDANEVIVRFFDKHLGTAHR